MRFVRSRELTSKSPAPLMALPCAKSRSRAHQPVSTWPSTSSMPGKTVARVATSSRAPRRSLVIRPPCSCMRDELLRLDLSPCHCVILLTTFKSLLCFLLTLSFDSYFSPLSHLPSPSSHPFSPFFISLLTLRHLSMPTQISRPAA